MSEEPGGFIPLSPPPSSIASSSLRSTLPHPRRTPLKTGGAKESTFIRFVDQRILHVQRRFAKRDSSLGLRNAHIKEVDEEGRLVQEIGETTARSDDWNDVPGYAGFGEAAAEVEEIVNVIWISGTRTSNIPVRSSCVETAESDRVDSLLTGAISHITGTSRQYHDIRLPSRT